MQSKAIDVKAPPHPAGPTERVADQEGISIRDLTIEFGHRPQPVFDNLNLHIPHGRPVSLVGPSGVGKTTLLHAISGIYYPNGLGARCSGKIFVGGKEPREWNGADGLVLAFQRAFLLDHLTAKENVLLPARAIEREAHDETTDRFSRISQAMRLEKYVDWRPRELSGGTLSRFALARSLILDPKYLLLDEPLNGVDTPLKHSIIEFLRADREGKSTLMVTHQLEDAIYFSEVITVLSGKEEPLTFENDPPDYSDWDVPEVAAAVSRKRIEILSAISDEDTKIALA